MGLHRLLYTLLHHSLRMHGTTLAMFLDIAVAFDEVAQPIIQQVANRIGEEGGGIAREILEFCAEIRTHVVTAFGLSEWYAQRGGVVRGGGGGLDPLLYVLATMPLHRDILHQQMAIRVPSLQMSHTVGTVGLIDDMGVLGET